MKRKVPLWICALGLSLLLLCVRPAIALAAEGAGVPVPEGRMQPLDVSAEAGDVRITVTEGIADGRVICLAWEIVNADAGNPVLVELAGMTVDGARVPVDNLRTNDRLIPFGGEDMSQDGGISGGVRGFLPNPPVDGMADVRLDFVISRPTGAVVVVDAWLYDTQDAAHAARVRERMAWLEAAGVRVAGKDALDAEAWMKNGDLAVTADGYVLSLRGDYYETYGANVHRPGRAEAVDRLTLSLRMETGGDAAVATVAGDVVQGDRVFDVGEMIFTPLSTVVDIAYWPADGVYETEEAALWRVSQGIEDPWFLFADADGAIVAFVGLDASWGWIAEAMDGGYVLRMRDLLPGLSRTPAYVGFFPGFVSTYDVARMDDEAGKRGTWYALVWT